ncbi:ankyrin repeat-containing domain protein [Aspergillus novoparasiticus]|uniref:Ankyrin repeat-containing domain protein n=1 Tax=Aspergillus novoparasiticus TaxID=986946 RepID=A0A5N6F8I7_9EURO|nr:ankyrin repeat-containing domain protein [Aspergillus novoparasiticus]
MRLLKTRESPTGMFEIIQFADNEIPPYSILSHTWEQEEVTFQNISQTHAKDMLGYEKLRQCCAKAKDMGYEYTWIDTCCIDKTSSAELSEAINSMFRYYQASSACYAFLSDVPSKKSFAESKWFTRGWTLQELIAPATVIFFDENWEELGTKTTLQKSISECTRIPESIFSGEDGLDTFGVAQRMSWAAERETTRIEDRAYCLLGIFGVNMPLLYGERENAFIRLQEEIMRVCEDHSLFAWRSSDTRGILATSPAAFIESHDIVQFTPSDAPNSPFTVTSIGVHLELRILGIGSGGLALAILHCKKCHGKDTPIAIYVRDTLLSMERFTRVRTTELEDINLNDLTLSLYPPRKICLQASRIMRMRVPKDELPPIPYPETYLRKLMRSNQRVALHNAVEQRLLDNVWLLLTRADLEPCLKRPWDNHNRTLLALAAANGHNSMVKLLLKRGAAVDIDESSGQSALSRAAQRGHLETCKILLDEGANIDTRDDGMYPLLWAAENGHQAIVELLLNAGANTQAQDKSDKTALFMAAERGHKAVVKLLLEEGANTEARDKWDRTPIFLAAEHGHEAIVKLLLDAGAKVNAKDHWKRTPKYWATVGKHTAVVKLLQSRS